LPEQRHRLRRAGGPGARPEQRPGLRDFRPCRSAPAGESMILAAHARRDAAGTGRPREVSHQMKTTARRLTKAEIRRLVEGFAKALNAHDLDAALEYLTDDVVWTHPFTVEPLHGKAAVRADLAETFRSFPDLHSPLEDTRIFLDDAHKSAVTTW